VCSASSEHRTASGDLFLVDGNSRRIDLLLERVGALEPFSRPEFHRAQSQRQTFGGDHQARVHEDAANGMLPRPASLILATVDLKCGVCAVGIVSPIGCYRRSTIGLSLLPRRASENMQPDNSSSIHDVIEAPQRMA